MFLASAILEFVELNIIGPLPKMLNGNQLVPVMKDRYKREL